MTCCWAIPGDVVVILFDVHGVFDAGSGWWHYIKCLFPFVTFICASALSIGYAVLQTGGVLFFR